MLRVPKKQILAFTVVAVCIAAFGQIRTDTKVSDFRIPLFDEAGFRAWQLTGETATYQSASQIKIDNMVVNQYVADQENLQIAELSSPEAIFHLDTTTAFGPGLMHIKTDSFEVVGYDWIWIGDKKQITFNNTVKVTINEGIGDILK